MSPFQKFDHKLIFVILIRYINTKLLKSCSKNQKLLEVAKFGKSCAKRQKLLKSCRAQSVRARGGAYLKNRDQIINVRTIGHASCADTQRRVFNLWTTKLKLFGTTFNGTGNFSERRRREALGGLGGTPTPENV